MATILKFKHYIPKGNGSGVMGATPIVTKDTENLLSFAKIVLFFANNTSTKLYRTKLHKLLFYAQFLYYKRRKQILIEDEFICQKYGPVLPKMDDYLATLQEAGLINIVPDQYGSVIVPKIRLKNDAYEKEISTLKEVATKFDTWTAGEISEYSHKEPLWKKAYIHQVIPVSKAEELNEF